MISEGSLASGVRRIEATTGKGAVSYKRKLDGIIRSISKACNTEPERIQEKVESLMADMDRKDKEIAKLKDRMIVSAVDEAIAAAHDKNGVKIVSMMVADGKADDLRKVTDVIRDKVKSCIVVVGSEEDGKGMIVVAVSRDLQAGYHAGKIVKKMAEKYEGKGGGGPQIAQAGIAGNRVSEALRNAKDMIDG